MNCRRGSKNTREILSVCCLSLVILVAGCTKMVSVGFETVKSPPPSHVAAYVVTSCTNLSNGQSQKIGPFNYYLEELGANSYLYEFDQSNNGAKFHNHWVEQPNDIFFGRVRMIKMGFKFDLPADRTLPGKRYVYLEGQFTAYEEGGNVKIQGTPYAECTMIPDPGNPASVAPVAETLASGLACTSDNECPGEEVCENGACVAPRGAGDATVSASFGGGSEENVPHCYSDKECKGERICMDGKCADPQTVEEAVGQECRVDVNCPGSLVCESQKCARPKKKRR